MNHKNHFIHIMMMLSMFVIISSVKPTNPPTTASPTTASPTPPPPTTVGPSGTPTTASPTTASPTTALPTPPPPTATTSAPIYQFITPSTPVIDVGDAAIVGYSSNTSIIWILDGLSVAAFDTSNDQFTNCGWGSSPLNIYATSQGFTQINKYLYILPLAGESYTLIHIFDVDTGLFGKSLNMTPAIYPSACAASITLNNNDYLFALGGNPQYEYENALQILDVSGNTWSLGPNMIYRRAMFACVTDGVSQLYGIAGKITINYGNGYVTYSETDTIEVLDVASLINGETPDWSELDNKLSSFVHGSRALLHSTDVLVIGGEVRESDMVIPMMDINIIDTLTNTISVPFQLWEWEYSPSSIVINDERLYVFSQYSGWAYMQLSGTGIPTTSPTYPYSHYCHTDSPTVDPTGAPSISPTQSPTTPPTLAPTQYPSDSPSSAPSTSPSQSPTFTPSTPPTNAPSYSPSTNPSDAPSGSPSSPPTNNPTHNPTLLPSNAPSFSPTRVPTMDDAYDSFISVIYGLKYLSSSNIATIINNATQVMTEIAIIIEKGYTNQDAVIIAFKDFWCRIMSINGRKLRHMDDSMNMELGEADIVTLESEIDCNAAQCYNIINDYDKQELSEFVTDELRAYFDANALLEFSVISMGDEAISLIDEPTDDLTINYTFYISLFITFVLVNIGLMACCYNDGVCFTFPRCRGCRTVDDGKYIAMIAFALHFYDFSSDINLCTEIWFQTNIFDELLLLVCGVTNIIFIVIPYGVNLYFAGTVNQRIKGNEFTKTWLETYSRTFTLFVVFTGGFYASLVLVSSNIFGLSVFSSGLTRWELKKLAKLRVIGNVLLENIPQLFLQILYVYAIGKPSQAVIFSFIASFLSVISTVLAYYIDRHNLGTNVIDVYLFLQCERSSSGNNQISKMERRNIQINKGRRRRLTTNMTEIFGIPPKNIQIGASMVSTYGLIMHVFHFLYESDLVSSIQDEPISPQSFINDLYSSFQHHINGVFRDHFQLGQDFHVVLHHSLSMTSRMHAASAGSVCIVYDDNDKQNTQNNTEMATPQANDLGNAKNNHDSDIAHPNDTQSHPMMDVMYGMRNKIK